MDRSHLTLNPWMGCFKVSQGCKFCYADIMTSGRMGLDVFGYDTSKRKKTGPQTWKKPVKWNRESRFARLAGDRVARVFCASLADVFEDAPGPNEWRVELWELIRQTPYLDWQILTKRPENIARMLPDAWGAGWKHVWLGTSIESNRVADRSPILTSVPAFNHFISYEPAIGPGDEIPLEDIEWCIVGGESGPKRREMDLQWAIDMRERCEEAGVAYFFKQSSGLRTEMGIDALGEVVRNYPESWDRQGGIYQ